uniref:Uncharacterized protein n=1 Tax=Candidozyma auris TaxID=498019 RepID=A0A0L0P8E3_CANAR
MYDGTKTAGIKREKQLQTLRWVQGELTFAEVT